jgi:hypothetical protein
MSERKSNFLIPVLGAAVVAAGGAGAYYYLNQGGLNLTPGTLGSAKIIPGDSLMVISVSMDSNKWGQLEQFQSPETKKLFDETINKIKQESAASGSDIDFDKDIKSWAGDITMAILPSAKTAKQSYLQKPLLTPVVDRRLKTQIAQKDSEVVKPNVLLIVAIKDKIAAAQFGEKVKAKSGGKVTKKSYKDTEISEYPDAKAESKSKTYTTLLGEYLVISPDQKSVEKSIDAFKGAASMDGQINPGDLELKNLLVQFYIPKFAESVEQLASMNPNSVMPPQSLQQLKAIKSLVMGVGVDGEGLRLKANTKFDPEIFKYEYKGASGKVLSQFPAETFAIVTGSDISSRWKQVVQDASKNPDAQKALDEARQNLKNSLGLDLDKDIFGWMDGEFAIGAIASTEGVLAQFGAGPVMTFQTSDRKTAEATLKKLEDFAKENKVPIQTRDDKGVNVTEWSLGSGFTMGYGWHDKDSLFVTFGSLVNIMASKPSNTLENSPSFKTITSSFSKPNIGYFYLDMDKTWSLVSSKIPPDQKSEITPEALAMINTVRGIGMTAYMPDKTTNKFEALLSLKPKGGK